MKNSKFHIVVSCLLFANYGWSQKFEITPIGGFQFGGKMDVTNGKLKIDESSNYGIILDYYLVNYLQLEFFWLRQDSELKLKEHFGVKQDLFKSAVEYFQLGLLYYFDTGKVNPFAGFTVGAVNFAPQNINQFSETRFAVALKGGVKYFFNDKIGLRLQGQLLLPINYVGTSFFCLSGGYCSPSVPTGALLQGIQNEGIILSLLQGAINGGLIMAF